MTKIQVIGAGCARCAALAANAERAVAELGIDCEIEKVTDMRAILESGVLMTPALIVDGQVKVSGKVVDAEAIKAWLT